MSDKRQINLLTFNAAQSTVAIKVKHYIHFVSENKNVWQIALCIVGGKVAFELTVRESGNCIAKIYAARATQNIQGYDDDVGRLSPCMLSTSCCCLLRGLGGFLSPVRYKQEAYLERKQAVIIVLALHN